MIEGGHVARSEIGAAMDRIRSRFDRIDALFVNAGVGDSALRGGDRGVLRRDDGDRPEGRLLHGPEGGPAVLTGAAVVLNASINAHLGMPNSSVYSPRRPPSSIWRRPCSPISFSAACASTSSARVRLSTPIFATAWGCRGADPPDQGVDHRAGPAEALRPADEIAAAVLYLSVERVGVRGGHGVGSTAGRSGLIRRLVGLLLAPTGKRSPAFSGDSVTPGDSGFKRPEGIGG